MADGLGRMVAELLASERHSVMLHARNSARGDDAMRQVSSAEGVVTGDLSSIEDMRSVLNK
jgi:NAD(P)-dependent dehydrogenase (short-subunit alcohol dehydrogenase family)